jgi:hypothetical protein
MAISGLLFPELFYDWFMAACYLQGAVERLRDAEKVWKEMFMVLALNSIIPQPDWLCSLFRRQHADPVPRERD